MKTCQQTSTLEEIKKDLAKREMSSVLHDEKINRMSEDLTEIKNTVKELVIKQEAMMEKLSQNFASKWVERVVKWLIGLVLLSVFGAILKTVLID